MPVKPYIRTCIDCGDMKEYTAPTMARRCWSCANKTRREESKVGCKRVCVDCEKVDFLRTPHAVAKSPRCASCASKLRAKTTPMPKGRKPKVVEYSVTTVSGKKVRKKKPKKLRVYEPFVKPKVVIIDDSKPEIPQSTPEQDARMIAEYYAKKGIKC